FSQDFRHEVNLLVNLRHPNIIQFLGAVTEKKPLMLVTEYLRGVNEFVLYLCNYNI
ncbi:probable serine/threonine-protein kinase drkd, partial [Phtheirospermum japonicum]